MCTLRECDRTYPPEPPFDVPLLTGAVPEGARTLEAVLTDCTIVAVGLPLAVLASSAATEDKSAVGAAVDNTVPVDSAGTSLVLDWSLESGVSTESKGSPYIKLMKFAPRLASCNTV